MNYPKIFLAIDNCFASKRWTNPEDWMNIIKSLGVSHIEANADNECDALYMDKDYLQDWAAAVNIGREKYAVQVVNLYSGHGTYATLGLAHTDIRNRKRILNLWLKPMVELSSTLKAGFGFFCHAFSEAVIQDGKAYSSFEQNLYDDLAELAEFAAKQGCYPIGVEQMYSPHQIPWTIEGAKNLIFEVHQRSGAPFYITIDVGHQTGQRKFLRPNSEKLKKIITGDIGSEYWVGASSTMTILEEAKSTSNASDEIIEKLNHDMDQYQYLFSHVEDGDTYAWLQRLGCYSPIIHLQQTNGMTSSHWPFTDERNRLGTIQGANVINALAESYEQEVDASMPKRCERIYLTLEIFSGTADINHAIISNLKESVSYWRRFVPEDGMSLDELKAKGNS